MKVSSQCKRPFSSSWARNARQIRSQVLSSSQRRSRLQQVDGLGYPPGRSRQRAPVLSTQRIPSITARLLIHGRPPLRLRGRRGSKGAILSRCWSVNGTVCRGTRSTSQAPPPGVSEPLFTSLRPKPGYETASKLRCWARLRRGPQQPGHHLEKNPCGGLLIVCFWPPAADRG